MQRPLRTKPSLDHLRQSPVRGQLEPHDSKTAAGWRYLQTTDTPDQLKVLLPPATASMYEEILRLEAVELAKKTQVNWTRVLEIRHLKDRMIRKTQRLSTSGHVKRLGRGELFTFETISAPADFRLKEMEKWLRTNHPPPPKPSPAHTLRHKISSTSCCARCSKANYANFSKIMVPRTSPVSSPRVTHVQLPVSEPLPIVVPEPRFRKQNQTRVEASDNGSSGSSPPPDDKSDDIAPLPHPLRIRSNPSSVQEEEETIVPPSPPPKTDDNPQPPTLARRRSCLKRTGIVDAAKRVSWADDNGWVDQIAKYSSAAQDALESGKQWEETRGLYLDQMSKLDELHSQVAESLERLRQETEHFREVDDAIRLQRDTLQMTFSQLEQTQDNFLTKVHQVLDEVSRTVTICGDKTIEVADVLEEKTEMTA